MNSYKAFVFYTVPVFTQETDLALGDTTHTPGFVQIKSCLVSVCLHERQPLRDTVSCSANLQL